MSETPSRGIINLVYTLLLTFGLLMHMSISGVEVGSLIIGIFTEPSGILTFISVIFTWFLNFIFRVHTIFILGTTLILWFVILPMLVRYKFIRVKVNLLLALTVSLYLFLPLKMYGFVAI